MTQATQTAETKVPIDVELKQEIEALKDEINTLKSKTSMLDKLKFIDANLERKDLNEQVGNVIIGYGNETPNKPHGAVNGYFINIPHNAAKDTYNKQIFLPRSPNEIWVRNQENGVWSDWTKIQ